MHSKLKFRSRPSHSWVTTLKSKLLADPVSEFLCIALCADALSTTKINLVNKRPFEIFKKEIAHFFTAWVINKTTSYFSDYEMNAYCHNREKNYKN